MKKIISFIAFISMSFTGSIIEPVKGAQQITITIIYDNYVFKEGTSSDWGFACLIEGTEKTILFDTGYQGQILLQNIDNLGIDLDSLDLIVISHNHLDHTGGLDSVLGRKSDLPVFFGASFPASFSQNISNKGATPIRVNEPIEICEHVFSTGELQGNIYEQSLILDTENGLVIITGCSHPGIINILKRAQDIIKKDIYLVFGGFHLLNLSYDEIDEIIQEFKALGVQKCGPTHCTGDRSITLFKEAYGENYFPMGVGQVIKILKMTTNIEESDDGELHIQDAFQLNQNYPNPFKSSTIIQYTIHKSAPVKLKIFNLSGQEIDTLINTYQTAGEYEIMWQPEGLSSGVYLYGLNTGRFSEVKKLILNNSSYNVQRFY